MTPAHAGLAALAALFWGATYVISDLALETTPPLLFAALRFFFAALFIMVVPKPPVRWRILILVGLLHFAVPFGLIFIALDRGMPPGMTSLLVHIQAFFTIGIAMCCDRNKRRLVSTKSDQAPCNEYGAHISGFIAAAQARSITGRIYYGTAFRALGRLGSHFRHSKELAGCIVGVCGQGVKFGTCLVL